MKNLLHKATNNIASTGLNWFIMALSLISVIFAGFIVFHILSLIAMPAWLMYTLAFISSAPLLAGVEKNHSIGVCAALFCFYSFILAGGAIAPAIIASVSLGFVAEAILYTAHAFFKIEMLRYNDYETSTKEEKITLFQSTDSKMKYVIAQLVAIAVMVCVFKFASAAIIAAASPYAVAILGVLGTALAIAFFTNIKYPYDMFDNNFIIKYIDNFNYKINHTNSITKYLKHPMIIAPFAAIATFIVLINFPLTLAGAPTIIAAIVAFNAGIVAQQIIIYTPVLAAKVANHFTRNQDITNDRRDDKAVTFELQGNPEITKQNDETIEIGKHDQRPDNSSTQNDHTHVGATQEGPENDPENQSTPAAEITQEPNYNNEQIRNEVSAVLSGVINSAMLSSLVKGNAASTKQNDSNTDAAKTLEKVLPDSYDTSSEEEQEEWCSSPFK